MTNETKLLLTIVAESSLEKSLCKDFEMLGATGYTITSARGKGNRGHRDADWDHNGNIRMEIICNEDVASSIKQHVQKTYYDNFAMILYSFPVEVLRSEKFE